MFFFLEFLCQTVCVVFLEIIENFVFFHPPLPYKTMGILSLGVDTVTDKSLWDSQDEQTSAWAGCDVGLLTDQLAGGWHCQTVTLIVFSSPGQQVTDPPS